MTRTPTLPAAAAAGNGVDRPTTKDRAFAFIPEGTGVLLVPVPERADLMGLAKGANPEDNRDRKDRV